MEPKIHQRVTHAADQVMILSRLNEKDISGCYGLLATVDFDPAFALKEAKELCIGMNVGSLVIVGYEPGTVERESTAIDALALEDGGKHLADAYFKGDV